jgi:hypothetical protein
MCENDSVGFFLPHYKMIPMYYTALILEKLIGQVSLDYCFSPLQKLASDVTIGRLSDNLFVYV